MSKKCFHFFSLAIDPIIFKLACNEDIHDILMSSILSQIGPLTVEIAALEHLKSPNRFIATE